MSSQSSPQPDTPALSRGDAPENNDDDSSESEELEEESENFDLLNWAARTYRTLIPLHVVTDYRISNTYGRDVLADYPGTSTSRGLQVVLAACGDIRNVVETIVANRMRNCTITFVLNDLFPCVIARNIVMLELADRLWEGDLLSEKRQEIAAATWLHVWGSIALTREERIKVDGILNDIADGWLPSWLKNTSKRTQEQITECCKCWAACGRTLDEVRAENNARRTGAYFEMGVEDAVRRAGLNTSETTATNCPKLLLKAELHNHAVHAVNPTLLDVPSLKYNLRESSIFRAVDMRAFVGGDVSQLHEAACAALMLRGAIVARAIRRNRVFFRAMPGDLTYVLKTIPRGTVDVVDLSNAMDYVTLPAVLFAAVECLRRPLGLAVSESMMFFRDADTADAISMRGGSLPAFCDALGVTISTAHEGPRKTIWSMRPAAHGKSASALTGVLKMGAAWCAGVARWRTPIPPADIAMVASWPSALLALKLAVVAARKRGSEREKWAPVVVRMCSAHKSIYEFGMQLRAYAAVVDGDDAVGVAKIVFPVMHRVSVPGASYHACLCVGDRRVDVMNIDVENRSCEFLVCAWEEGGLRGENAYLAVEGCNPTQERILITPPRTILDRTVFTTRPMTHEELFMLREAMLT